MKRLFAPLFAALALLVAPATLHAQDAGPEATVIAFMDAFSAKDAETMTALMMPDTVVASVQELEGPDDVGFSPMADLVAQLAGLPFDIAEPLWDLRTEEFGTVAVVSASYDFLISGNRSHCGTDIFTLMRVDGAWKIATITYSHETEGCEGPPAE
ncbi:DUF4440 domain-containing protein [Erythrobacter sp. EC-HK427]|uniref:DUF4440 domain-containing protein n=1 Tax=Erythrobacter sp. EC-HK427 TaxID=2038396 RepID=UPI00125C8E5D|nr:DUF4440 domain-containing protein [Erythrobacter sp. EC-HK427]VVT09500.1 conserved exported hypothetical protein [Erythrobacter sp. EC-HK427]